MLRNSMGTKFQLLTVCLKCKCWTSLVVQWLRIHLPATLACDGHTLSVECVCVCARAHMCVRLVTQSCWLFGTPWTVAAQAPLSMGILQARILEWVAMSFSRDSSWPRKQIRVSCIAGRFLISWATMEALCGVCSSLNKSTYYLKKKKKNPPSNAGDEVLIPDQGVKIPHATGELSLHATTKTRCSQINILKIKK